MIEIEPLSPKRWAHCRSVAAFSYELALKWGADPMKAYLAGSFHDIARELPPERGLLIAEEYGYAISPEEKRYPILVHGFVSAVVARENYGITDREILSAMEKHTLGDEEMTLLDKIIYLADEIEPLRQYPGVDELRKLAFTDFNKALLQGIEQSLKYQRERGLEPNPKTLKMYREVGLSVHTS
ncbi:MAG: bis(5'-nucleosyl)-tetraphosphatase (symmetrical) YqeK [Bacillota bacterium]|nr:bis(5'-nucleosyl)-tetraphosphatase (symmetrical) YqeK [Bacillota bacterium]